MINLLQKISTIKLTRAEFLLYIGTIFITILGIPALYKILSTTSPYPKPIKLNKMISEQKQRTFGEGPYGI